MNTNKDIPENVVIVFNFEKFTPINVACYQSQSSVLEQ